QHTAHRERDAVRHALDERREPVAITRGLPDDRPYGGHVRRLQRATERVGEQLLGHRADEYLRTLDQHGAQTGDAVERSAVEEPGGGIDPCASLLGAPRADGIEILQR